MTFLFLLNIIILVIVIVASVAIRIICRRKLDAIDGSSPKFKKGEFKGRMKDSK